LIGKGGAGNAGGKKGEKRNTEGGSCVTDRGGGGVRPKGKRNSPGEGRWKGGGGKNPSSGEPFESRCEGAEDRLCPREKGKGESK